MMISSAMMVAIMMITILAKAMMKNNGSKLKSLTKVGLVLLEQLKGQRGKCSVGSKTQTNSK